MIVFPPIRPEDEQSVTINRTAIANPQNFVADVFQLTASERVPRQWLGDRAYHLSQLATRQEPILPGVVVSGRLLRDIWQKTPWREPLVAELSHSTLHLQTNDARQLQSLAQQISQALLEVELAEVHLEALVQETQHLNANSFIFHPSLYIDRAQAADSSQDPSAELVALLNSHVSRGDRTSLSQTLKQSWAELFRARSLLYWQRAGIPLEQINLAILIQPLQPTLASGLLNLRSPWIDITATRGLPQTLSNGYTHPERYRLEADRGVIHQQELGNPFCYYHLDSTSGAIEWVAINPEELEIPVLNSQHLLTLHQQSQRLQPYAGDEADLEWVLTHPNPDVAPTWYISQYYPQGSPNLRWPNPANVQEQKTSSPFQRQGIAASSGQAHGVVSLLDDVAKLPLAQTETPNQILVVPYFEPQDAPPCAHIVGLITEGGSRTSHGAIWARELGIPAVMGVAGITAQVTSGQRIYLDGDRGQVHLDPPQTTPLSDSSSPLSSPPTVMSQTPIIHGTQLFLSVSQPHLAPYLAQLPVDGVGLIRSELLAQSLALTQASPRERLQQLSEGLITMAKAFAPRPLYYRSWDGGRPGDALGLRGTLAYRQDATRFEEELTALAQVREAGYDNVHLILPFVRSVGEFKEANQRIQQQGLDPSHGFQCWLMAEVPSVAVLLEDYVQAGVQGIAIGSHDLSQLILGIDRDDPQVADQFDLTHPAVLEAIARLARSARQLKIPCTLCADSLPPESRDRTLEAFVRCGVTGLSVSQEHLESQAWAIARAEWRLLLDGFWGGREQGGEGSRQ
ncbi:putative PEP-binding protein [Sodalinema gerasimenkoae]|uniref:putative PEP-binding protein n=1 Tax=Sodalinema gerasimenkoae TaxID=2862348 RepID=UPI001356EC6F|nr:putative PEP-binding protein [Sodalinema gerasimenkoae]